MYHYLFTNDLRISNLDNFLQRAGHCFSTNTVPTAAENKNDNNNMMTLGFYFNLTESSRCAEESAKGNVRAVVLNFIKKFQFPNPRTSESYNNAVTDGIVVAPMRVILQILYNMNMYAPDEAYLTREEILNFIFYNASVAKSENVNIQQLISEILEYRNTGLLPASVETFPEQRNWKHEERQIREMIKILTWAGCASENVNQALVIHHDHLSKEDKAALFDVLTYNKFWRPTEGLTFQELKANYQNYMDMAEAEVELTEEELLRDSLMGMENQEFIFAAINLLAENNKLDENVRAILSDKEKCASLFKHNGFHGIMFEINPKEDVEVQRKDVHGHSRYYAEKYQYAEKEFLVSSEWRPDREDSRKAFIDWIMDVIKPKSHISFVYETGLESGYSRNRILFGAPGTGKSYTVNKEKNTLLQLGGTYERVTFHPDYTYANFVGTYKPVPCKDSEDRDAITYEYVPGPFMRTLVKALKNSQEGGENIKPHLLIIEEINRANVAAVFGDVFQLLDREENEVSEYPIQATEDMKKYLAKELKVPVSECEEIRIPDNMFIWATMNSADQGVFPMDTAFKRRWDFTYLGINSSEDGIAGKKVILGTGEYKRIVEWNALRKAINKELLKYKVNEDKLMGPYFISKKNIGEATVIDADKFIRIFKNKVLMYLFDDAAKQKRPSLFAGCEEKNLYSAICDEFEEKGVHIFCEDIYNQFIDVPEEG